MNLQPSEAEAGFDIRIPPTADTESLEKRIAEEWAPASRNMTFVVYSETFLSWKKNWYLAINERVVYYVFEKDNVMKYPYTIFFFLM